jgi:membrane-bound lytic murein transglycosylase D
LTDPDGPHRLLVPAVVADDFTARLAALDGPARARLAVHTVAAGESLASVAGTYKVPKSFLQRINAEAPAELQPGHQLLVPAGDVAQLRAGLGADLERGSHRVRPGESLWSISRRHGMSVRELARMNGMSTQATLRPGQRLMVAGVSGDGDASADSSVSHKVNYTVRHGDTLSTIARRFSVSVRQLQGWNNMGRSTTVRAGQRLTIHLGGNTDVGG